MLQKLLALLGAALISFVAHAQSFDHTHAAFTALLKKHVVLVDGGKASKVKYAELKKDQPQLKAYLDSLSAVSETDFNGWSKAQRMAFLINAYNGFTLELILQNHPVKSIKDIGNDLFSNRWKKKFFKLFGQESFLDRIEHETLRKPGAYNDPRVHYAVNCASIGCPALREEAFTAEKLDRQLEEQAVRFLSDRSRNRYANGKLEVSKIFDWFKVDWESGYTGFDGKTPPIKSREEYFARYAKLLADSPADQQAIAAGKAPIAHLDYDWSLNGN
ncbi:MAG TPA: DUF547 domain-containing protein [Usitatibacteraceae bacterium]|nr:DUF547 domain-containing protein [Usitatibacteraceae bacterium]